MNGMTMNGATRNTLSRQDTLDRARTLVSELEQADEATARKLYDTFTNGGDAKLYQEVGQLTRNLHDALKNFGEDERFGRLAQDDFAQSRDRLRYVLTLTEQSARRTLAGIEAIHPITDEIVRDAGARGAGWADRIRGELRDILIAQEYQDLTGQVIQRVMRLLEEVESSLIGLIREVGGVLDEHGAGQGPQAASAATVKGQDDVDDLLSSLGF